MLILQFLRGVEIGWLQVRWKLVEADYWVGFERSLAFIVDSPGGRRAYERNRGSLGDEFASEVDRKYLANRSPIRGLLPDEACG